MFRTVEFLHVICAVLNVTGFWLVQKYGIPIKESKALLLLLLFLLNMNAKLQILKLVGFNK